MFKYARLFWSVTFTLDIFFSQQSVALRFFPVGMMDIATLCIRAIPKKIVPSPCVLLFHEGMSNITALHAKEDTRGTPRILEGPEYGTQLDQGTSQNGAHCTESATSTSHQGCSFCSCIKLFLKWSSCSVHKGELLSLALMSHTGSG